MLRARHRKSKSASGIEGLDQIQKQKVVSARRSTDSQRDDMIMFNSGGPSTPLQESAPVPMTKLPNEEVKPKKRTPSLIARLMGLEAMPSPRKQPLKKGLDSRIKKGPTSPPEFKDVYEDLEVSSHPRLSSRWSAGPDLPKLDTALIQQKLVNSKHLPTVEKGGHIAVLKPSNLEKYESKRKDGLLLEPHSHHISRSSPSRAQASAETEEKALRTRIIILKPDLMNDSESINNLYHGVGLSRPISKEARALAREVTMQLRRECFDESTGYIGDESSYDASGSEPDDFTRKSLDDNINNIRRYLASSLGKLSVNREAKRRLSERWRTSHEYQELEVGSSKGSTLGEMLAVPDKNGKTKSLGISSRDGWRDELKTRSSSSSRSKSLPPSQSHKRSPYHNNKSMSVKRSLSHNEDSLSKSWGKKPHPSEETFSDEMELDASFEIRMEANIKDISEQQPSVDVMMVTEPESTNMPLESCESLQKQSDSVIDGDGSGAGQEEKGCSFQVPPSKLGSNKEPDHPSPNSVLEDPLPEDSVTTPSSDSFENVGSDLQGLRLQLNLLKMESNTDVPTLSPIGEDEMETSAVVSSGSYLPSDPRDWEHSYSLAVLITSNIQDSDYSTFKASWYSQDCPLDPNLFEDLEKLYSDQTTGTEVERRLLFDRINWALMQISWEYYSDSISPWVMQSLSGGNSRWKKRGVRDVVESLVEGGVLLDGGVWYREMEWPGWKGEIEMIGKEIEEDLIEEIMAELILCM